MPNPPICETLHLDQRKLPAEVFERISDVPADIRNVRNVRGRRGRISANPDATRRRSAIFST